MAVGAILGLLAGLLVTLLGLALLLGGRRKLRQWRLVAATPTTPAARVVEEGPVEVEGEVQPEGPLAAAPFSGEPCVFGAWGVTAAGPRTGRKQAPDVVAEGRVGGAFRVKDASGSVLVDPEGAELDVRETWRHRALPGEPPPQPVARFLVAESVDVDELRALGRSVAYGESVLRPGDRVFVLGVAGRDDAGRLRVGARGGFPFVVSVRPEREVARQARAAGIALTLFGAIVTGVGLYVLRASWGLL